MRILGISDGLDAGAALAVDDRLVAAEQQSSFDRRERSRAFPWDAIEDVLRRTRTTPAQVDTVAVAGRWSPPLMLRKRPSMRRVARTPFSGAFEVGVFYQAMLRQTGMGALQAARAADWFREQLGSRGFRARVVMVDIHAALANAAYRTQPDDDVLIVTLHPMGDGVSLAVHRGTGGQIDRVFEQRGFSSLHVHLARCAAAIGCPDTRSMWSLAGRDVDPVLLATLQESLRAEGGRLSRATYPLPERPLAYDQLRRVPRDVAAATVHENLRAAVTAVVAHHVRTSGIGDLAVAGEVFEDARLVADLADVPGVRSVRCPADPGSTSLAVGAAAAVAGTRTRWFDPTGDDPELEALDGQPLDLDAVADALARGDRVGWTSGASGPASFRTGERCVLSRADRVVQRGLLAPGDVALWAETPEDGVPVHRLPLDRALRTGSAAVRVGSGFAERYVGALGPDGRSRVVPVLHGDPLQGVLQRLDGLGAGACLTVEPLPGRPARADALRLAAREAGCSVLVAGSRLVAP